MGPNSPQGRAATEQQQQMAQQQQQMNPAIGQQIQTHSRKLYQENLPAFIQRYGGVPENIPPEAMEKFKRERMNTAKNTVTQELLRASGSPIRGHEGHAGKYA